MQFNSILTEIIEEQKRNNRLDIINKGKRNYQHEINYSEDNKWYKDLLILIKQIFFNRIYFIF